LARIPVEAGDSVEARVGTLDNLYVTLPRNTFEGLYAKIDVEKKLAAPVNKGRDAGQLTLIYKGKVIAEHPLVVLKQIPLGNAVQQAWGRFRNWLQDGNSAANEEGAGLTSPARQ
jgi:D-alanyl-D-alanine carboxypeptidase (penicillin-binding protein 5/6)